MRDIKKAIKEGKKVVGTFIWDIQSPILPKLFSKAGLDFVILDNEHGHFSYETILSMIQIAHGSDIATIVRIPAISRECIQRYCDMGCDGILVPMVESATQAKEAVRLAKYPPIGEKGMAFFKGNMDYDVNASIPDFVKEINDRLLVLVQAETAKSLENLDEMVAVEGVDGLFMGPLDLSASMGMLADYKNPEFLAAAASIMKAAKNAGKIASTFAGDYDLLEHCLKNGCDMVTWLTDSIILFNATTDCLDRIKNTPGY